MRDPDPITTGMLPSQRRTLSCTHLNEDLALSRPVLRTRSCTRPAAEGPDLGLREQRHRPASERRQSLPPATTDRSTRSVIASAPGAGASRLNPDPCAPPGSKPVRFQAIVCLWIGWQNSRFFVPAQPL